MLMCSHESSGLSSTNWLQGSHFNCNEVCDYCETIGTKLHVVAVYSPWLNGLLEGSNGILLNALKRLWAPGLGEDDYDQMTIKDIPNNWPEHLDAPSNISMTTYSLL